MSEFPTEFGVKIHDLSEINLGETSNNAIKKLGEAGLRVQLGMEPEDLEDIQEIANSNAVREFCPNDLAARFGNEQMARKWLKNGKGVFELRANNPRDDLAGYGWTGPKQVMEVPGGDTTFAVRLSPKYSGRHLGTPFAQAIVAGSQTTFGKQNIWLETWASNVRAVGSYLHAGAQLVENTDSYRPTLYPAKNETDGVRRDTRLFMRFVLANHVIEAPTEL